MADLVLPEQPPAAPRRNLGWGYLLLALLVLGIFAVYVFAPDLPRWLTGGAAPRPNDVGDEPTTAARLSGPALDARAVSTELMILDKVNVIAAPPPPAAIDRHLPGPTQPTYTAEVRAGALLAEAELRYAAMAWDQAASAAGKVAGLDATPATKERALAIARGAPALKRLFRELDERDELTRNWDSHPSLLRLTRNGQATLAVPLTAMAEPPQAVTDQPLAWVETLRRANRKGVFMYQGVRQFSMVEIDLGQSEIAAVDQAALHRDLLAQLERRVAALPMDATAPGDALAFYQAGRFAYRNRLDERVTGLLDSALRLDPDLGRNVREGNAAVLFGSMVIHAKNGNKQQRDHFMATIERRYKDTEQGRLARLFYDGRAAELQAALRGSGTASAPTGEAGSPVGRPEPPVLPVPVATGGPPELSRARTLYTEGSVIAAAAMNMPPTDERNRKYHRAAELLTQALAVFAACLTADPGNAAIAEEMHACQFARVAVIKYPTLD